jgi:CO/xanthine dehydrogenase FAD-binding subunit
MRPFEYIRPQSLDQSLDSLAAHGSDASVLAGGTDLLIEWRRLSGNAPTIVIDISRINELKGISSNNGSISIGSLATHRQVLDSPLVREFAPLLSSAAGAIGSPQIRNRGTVGGNIMNAAACADTVPPLIVLGATITLRSKAGSRQLNLEDLFVVPYQTNARPDEVLSSIQFPKLTRSIRTSFIKLGRRNALSISRLSVAALLERDNEGRIIDARIVPGAAFPRWRRVTEAEQMLVGERGSEKLFAAVGQKVSAILRKETGRRWSSEYKEPVLSVLVRRALEACN